MLTHKGTQTLTTPRLTLRKYQIDDAQDMFTNYASDAAVTQFLSWPPYDNVQDVAAFIANQIAAYQEDRYVWVIQYQEQVIGSLSVVQNDTANESCEIGYCIGAKFWNKGIMTEATAAALDFLLNEVGYNRVFAKHDIDNPASGRIMMKCGMACEGRLRAHYRRDDGTFSDAMVYSVLKDESTRT